MSVIPSPPSPRLFCIPRLATETLTRSIPAFTFYYRNGGQNCGSQSGTVKNWCQFADSRVLGGYVANGIVGFSFNAKQDASDASQTQPYPAGNTIITCDILAIE